MSGRAVAALSASALAALVLGVSPSASGAYSSSPLQTAAALPAGGTPQDAATNPIDDTVYVVTSSPWSVTAFNSQLDDSDSAAVGGNATRIAVNPHDDTVYVTDAANPGFVDILPGNLSSRTRLPLSARPRGIAVHPTDDTIYVTLESSNKLSIINGRNTDDSLLVSVGNSPEAVAVNPVDDTIYVANNSSGTVSIVSPSGSSVTSASLPGILPVAIAVHPTDDTVYVSGFVENRLLVANADFSQTTLIPYTGSSFAYAIDFAFSPDGSTLYAATRSNFNRSVAFNVLDLDDSQSFAVGTNPSGIGATDEAVFVANNGSQNVSVVTTAPSITSVTPSTGPTSGGTAISISGTGFLPGISTATVGGVPLAGVAVTPTSITGTTSPASAGAADVVVTKWGLIQTSVGAFTFVPPPPPPPVPPSAPRALTAVAGRGDVSLTWDAPASSGSFPITHYQAMASPGGAQCLTSGTSCTVTGLTSGTTYTFTVRALNGAGWGSLSDPSNAVTPSPVVRPSIVITGTRGEVRGQLGVIVSGTSTGLGMGAVLHPWTRFPGEVGFREGIAHILVSTTGTFDWQRRTGKRISVYVQTPDLSVRSNTVTIR